MQVSEPSNTRILYPSNKMGKWTLNWLTEETMNKYSVNLKFKFLNYFQKQYHYKVLTITLVLKINVNTTNIQKNVAKRHPLL